MNLSHRVQILENISKVSVLGVCLVRLGEQNENGCSRALMAQAKRRVLERHSKALDGKKEGSDQESTEHGAGCLKARWTVVQVRALTLLHHQDEGIGNMPGWHYQTDAVLRYPLIDEQHCLMRRRRAADRPGNVRTRYAD